jgi:hypothetical protein
MFLGKNLFTIHIRGFKKKNVNILKILSKTTANSNFIKHGLKNNHNINADNNIDLEILNTQNNIYINSVLEE